MAQTLTSARTARPIPALNASRRTARPARADVYTEQLLTAQSEAAWAAAERDALRADQDAVRTAQSQAAWAEAEAAAIRTRAQETEADLTEELAEMRQRVRDAEAELNLATLGLRATLPAIETGLLISELAA